MIAINGAGIAGLTLANCLQQLGLEYFIIEKSPTLSSVGAGIILQQNGLAILAALGLEKKLQGNHLTQMSLGNINHLKQVEYRGSLAAKAVHRGELQQLLLSAIPSENIYLGRTIDALEQGPEGLNLRLSDQNNKHCDLLIEAGGIHAELHGKVKLTCSGQQCWRKVVRFSGNAEHAAEYWFGKHRLGVIPIGKNQAYIFHVYDGDLTEKQRLDWLEGMLKEQQQGLLLKGLDLSGAWIKNELSQREIHWGQGRVIAIGDAAHGLTPNLGQGAVLAMEDAYSLASLIGKNLSHDQLRHHFIKQRHNRVSKVQKQSWQVGKMAHFTNPGMVFMRDLMLAVIPPILMLKMQQRFIKQFVNSMLPINKGV